MPEAVRLADSDLWLVPESDDVGGPDRILPGFGNTMRDGLGVRAERGGVELAIVGGLVADPVLGVRCTSIGIAGGRIVAQGTPDELRSSRRMAARVLVECRGPSRDVETALARVSGVSKVEIVANGRDTVTAALRPKDGYDVREEAARTVIQNGWPLREIRLEHATLEEFFVQVTANQAMATANQASET